MNKIYTATSPSEGEGYWNNKGEGSMYLTDGSGFVGSQQLLTDILGGGKDT